jgi:hypothetical protein
LGLFRAYWSPTITVKLGDMDTTSAKKPGGFRMTIGVETRGVSRIHKIVNIIRRQRMPELQTRQEEASWFQKN